jgi:hypothetical protein
LADGQREPLDDGQLSIMRDLVADPLPELILDGLRWAEMG